MAAESTHRLDREGLEKCLPLLSVNAPAKHLLYESPHRFISLCQIIWGKDEMLARQRDHTEFSACSLPAKHPYKFLGQGNSHNLSGC